MGMIEHTHRAGICKVNNPELSRSREVECVQVLRKVEHVVYQVLSDLKDFEG